MNSVDKDLLFSGRWSAREAINRLKRGKPAPEVEGLIEDVIDVLTEVLDVDEPSHVDNDRLPDPKNPKPTIAEETLDGTQSAGVPQIGKLFVAIGHNEGTGSQSHDGLDEWTTSKKVAERMLELAPLYGLAVKIGVRDRSLGYGDAMRKHGRASKEFGSDLAFEIHRNAYNGKVAGFESIVVSDAGTSAGRILAASASLLYPGTNLRGSLGVQDRRKGGNGAGFCRSQPCPALVLEPCFHDNPDDWVEYRDAVNKEARLYLGAAKAALMHGFETVPDLIKATEFVNRAFPKGILSV